MQPRSAEIGRSLLQRGLQTEQCPQERARLEQEGEGVFREGFEDEVLLLLTCRRHMEGLLGDGDKLGESTEHRAD